MSLAAAGFLAAVLAGLKGAWMPSIADEVATVTRTAACRWALLARCLLLRMREAMRPC